MVDKLEPRAILAKAYRDNGDIGAANYIEGGHDLLPDTQIHLLAIQDALEARTLANGEQVERITADKLGEIMQEEWGIICDDAQAHPLDMKHGRGTVLFYTPNHWTSQVAAALNRHLAALPTPTPTTDARKRVKVLEEALTWIAGECDRLRKGTDDWFDLVEISLAARTALGNKETDRHG